MSNMKVPITSDLRMVRLAQAGLMPSPANFYLARLLEAIRLDQAAKAQKGEGNE
jgi:hypothetical protein